MKTKIETTCECERGIEMKKVMYLGLLAAVMLTGCGNTNAVSESQSDIAETEQENTETETQKRYAAYQKKLEQILAENESVRDDAEMTDKYYEYDFAFADVNQDGQKELVTEWGETKEWVESCQIYAYDAKTDTVNRLDVLAGKTRFYANGIAEWNMSHGSPYTSPSIDEKTGFWPYVVTKYNEKTKKYEEIGSVFNWEKKRWDDELDEYKHFPDELDEDGDGLLYVTNDHQTDQDQVVDEAGYQAWIASYRGGYGEIELDYKDLTEENIANIRREIDRRSAGSAFGG